MTWADVNLEQSYAIVRDSMGNTTRYVHLGPKTSQLLLSLRERNPGDTYLLGGDSPHRAERIVRKFRVVSKQLGLTATRLHDLRVSCFIRLGSIGVDAQTLARFVGCGGWHPLTQNSSDEESVAHHSEFEEV